MFHRLHNRIHVHGGNDTIDYHLQDELLYVLDKLCVPKGEHLQLTREDHTFKVTRNFSVGIKWPTCIGMCIGQR